MFTLFFFTNCTEFLITENDFDFRFILTDFLSRRETQKELFFQLLLVIAVFCTKYGSAHILPYIGLIFNLLKFIVGYLTHPYTNIKI